MRSHSVARCQRRFLRSPLHRALTGARLIRQPASHRRRALAGSSSPSASVCTAIAAACGIGIRRDYSTIPAGQVGFDDLCGLQDYFDTIEAKLASPPALVNAVDIENQANERIQGGKNRFAFETDFQLKQLRRVLDENWSRLPEQLAKADRVEVEVHWSAKAGVRRVVTDSERRADHRARVVRPALSRLPVRAAVRRPALPAAARDVRASAAVQAAVRRRGPEGGAGRRGGAGSSAAVAPRAGDRARPARVARACRAAGARPRRRRERRPRGAARRRRDRTGAAALQAGARRAASRRPRRWRHAAAESG